MNQAASYSEIGTTTIPRSYWGFTADAGTGARTSLPWAGVLRLTKNHWFGSVAQAQHSVVSLVLDNGEHAIQLSGPMLHYQIAQTELLDLRRVVDSTAFPPDSVASEVDLLRRIRHYFSLNTSELAAILRVERPTVYSWLEGGAIRRANRDRVRVVHEIAQHWWRIGHAPLGKALHHTVAGTSIYDMLCTDGISVESFRGVFEAVAQRLVAEDRSSADFDVFPAEHFAAAPFGARASTIKRLSERRGKL